MVSKYTFIALLANLACQLYGSELLPPNCPCATNVVVPQQLEVDLSLFNGQRLTPSLLRPSVGTLALGEVPKINQIQISGETYLILVDTLNELLIKTNAGGTTLVRALRVASIYDAAAGHCSIYYVTGTNQIFQLEYDFNGQIATNSSDTNAFYTNLFYESQTGRLYVTDEVREGQTGINKIDIYDTNNENGRPVFRASFNLRCAPRTVQVAVGIVCVGCVNGNIECYREGDLRATYEQVCPNTPIENFYIDARLNFVVPCSTQRRIYYVEEGLLARPFFTTSFIPLGVIADIESSRRLIVGGNLTLAFFNNVANDPSCDK